MSINQADLTASRPVSASARNSGEHVLGTGPLELLVSRVEDLTPRIRKFELKSPRGAVLPLWTPGAHIEVPVALASTIRAVPPYGEHHDYIVSGDHIGPIGPPTHRFAQRWLDHSFRGLYLERDPKRVEGKLRQIVELAPVKYPDATIPGVRAYLTLHVAPAYPAPAHFEEHSIAILGELHPGGAFKSVLGTLDGSTLTLRPLGVDTRDVTLVYYRDNKPEPIALPFTSRSGDVLALAAAPVGSPVYVVAKLGGQSWLVASRK